jgi:hypothetical protein
MLSFCCFGETVTPKEYFFYVVKSHWKTLRKDWGALEGKTLFNCSGGTLNLDLFRANVRITSVDQNLIHTNCFLVDNP